MQPNHRSEYDYGWTTPDRIGSESSNLSDVAGRIVTVCGVGKTLDIGCGEGKLVGELLHLGVDAYGVDVSEVLISRCSQRYPSRFVQGSVLDLPYGDESFFTVVSTGCLEHLAPQDVPKALSEIYRVAGRYVFLRIATTRDRDNHRHVTVEKRMWWETRCFEAGFRKHPAYYRVNDYESLNRDAWQICVLLEKITRPVLSQYPLASLNEERGLHMDMLRDTGERSDAHIIRYHWACNYIKPGDRVLDAACGLGYGSHIVRHLTQAAKVVGIDGSEYAVDYAIKSFPCKEDRAEYRLGILPEILASFEDASFDAIISFETLEHMEEPRLLLQEFNRLLTPGGRIIVSVPNDWSDESGKDPNPYHLHVYTWGKLKFELSSQFILDEAFAQTATQCKISSRGKTWERRPRSLHKVKLTEEAPADCEWWLMTAMKSPLDSRQEYRERVFHNIAQTGHPSIRYAGSYHNPWLMHTLVNVTYRLKNEDALTQLANEVMSISPKISNDYAAALCIKTYRILDHSFQNANEVDEIIAQIDGVIADPPTDPMGLRWKVSLLFIKAKLLQYLGHFTLAKASFVQCASQDVRGFGVHLATKTTEAWFTAGKMAYACGDQEEARLCWERGVDYGNVLLSVSLDDILINRSFPNRFNHGDGVREYTVAWDNIARCANGLHLLKQGGQLDLAALENCFQTEYSEVTRDLIENRHQLLERTRELVEARQTLADRTGLLEHSNKDLLERTQDLVETRETLTVRTKLLEQSNKDLLERTQELVETRKTLAERSEDLVETRKTLTERTKLLEQSNQDLLERTQDLVETRKTLAERSEDLVETRQTLTERTKLLELSNKDPLERTQDLDETHETLAERTKLLEQSNKDLLNLTQELGETRQTLAERTELLEQSNKDLFERTHELLETRVVISEKTKQLETVREELSQLNTSLLYRFFRKIKKIVR